VPKFPLFPVEINLPLPTICFATTQTTAPPNPDAPAAPGTPSTHPVTFPGEASEPLPPGTPVVVAYGFACEFTEPIEPFAPDAPALLGHVSELVKAAIVAPAAPAAPADPPPITIIPEVCINKPLDIAFMSLYKNEGRAVMELPPPCPPALYVIAPVECPEIVCPETFDAAGPTTPPETEPTPM
jgi:hypothetical protein